MNLLLPQWDLLQQQLKAVDEKISERAEANEQVCSWRRCRAWATTPPWPSNRGSALSIASRGRQPGELFRPHAGCRNSGEATRP